VGQLRLGVRGGGRRTHAVAAPVPVPFPIPAMTAVPSDMVRAGERAGDEEGGQATALTVRGRVGVRLMPPTALTPLILRAPGAPYGWYRWTTLHTAATAHPFERPRTTSSSSPPTLDHRTTAPRSPGTRTAGWDRRDGVVAMERAARQVGRTGRVSWTTSWERRCQRGLLGRLRWSSGGGIAKSSTVLLLLRVRWTALGHPLAR
jgi:hypothetical protein